MDEFTPDNIQAPHAALAEMEAADPELAEKGRRVEAAWAQLLKAEARRRCS